MLKTICLILLLACLRVSAQPDSLAVYHPDIDTTSSLELDWLIAHEPSEPAIIYRLQDEYFLAIYQRQNWLSWNISSADEEAPFGFGEDISLERRIVNGKGPYELVLRWNHRNGHSGWRGGNSESVQGVQVWETDPPRCILSLTTELSFESWWQEWDPPLEEVESMDSTQVIDSGSYTEGYSFEFEFLGDNQVKLKNLEFYDEEEDTYELELHMGLYEYKEGCFRLISK